MKSFRSSRHDPHPHHHHGQGGHHHHHHHGQGGQPQQSNQQCGRLQRLLTPLGCHNPQVPILIPCLIIVIRMMVLVIMMMVLAMMLVVLVKMMGVGVMIIVAAMMSACFHHQECSGDSQPGRDSFSKRLNSNGDAGFKSVVPQVFRRITLSVTINFQD